jgi:hypothetical protein
MSLISGSPLLFFDRLSVAKFPSDASQCQQHIEHLVSNMHNLLEARALSNDDHNERIRLIVTLDMIGGAFQPDNTQQKCFPAQKARQFKELVARTMGTNNPLSDRFDYCFLFLINRSDDKKAAEFYSTLAYDGHSGYKSDEWIGCSEQNINALRDEAINKMDKPDDQMSLTQAETGSAYTAFITKLNSIRKKVSDRMEEAGLRHEFEELYSQHTAGITRVEKFRTFDYDSTLSSCVSELIGLCSGCFKKDSTFFIIRTDNSNAMNRCKSETYVLSLIQLLTTMPQQDYKNILLSSNLNATARIFTTNAMGSDDFDTAAFARLERLVSKSLPKLETARWREDRRVSYLHYAANTPDPSLTDAHRPINDKLSKERLSLFQDFENARQVPFFFGNKVGDWTWYKDVVRKADALYRFEYVNDQPLYDLPKRITDNELKSSTKECDYAELENNIRILKKDIQGQQKTKDLETYQKTRQELMKQFKKGIDKLKTEMVKLGYLACLFWLGVFSALAFTLSYAYHFLCSDNKDSYWLIAVCLCVSALLFTGAAIVSQMTVKSRIKAACSEIDTIYRRMQADLEAYLNNVNECAKQQDEADVRRRNIDEMESKLEAFKAHNKQVDLWVAHYDGIIRKLAAMRHFFNTDETEVTPDNIDIDSSYFDFDNTMPSLPDVFRKLFADSSVTFSTKNIKVNNVTCFVQRFLLAKHDD